MRIDEVLVYEERLNAKPIISAAIIKLDKVFKNNKHEMRIVGGAVRDIALGKSPKDIDFATDATPDEMMKILDRAGIRHKPTGLEHGTITAILDNEPFEITTLRADTETDGRHAKVEFVKSWEEDAKRRDLTYNAMSMDIEGNVYDYFGGMDDLQDKVSKFVGDAEERITEDYLRILRYFRFQGRLSKPTWDGDTLEAITKHAKGLSGISAERIWAEMGKVLSGQNVASVVSMIEKTGVSKVIGLSTNNANTLKDKSNPVLALAQLDNSVDLAKRWKFSNNETQLLDFLVKNKNNPLDQKKVEDMIADGVDKDLISALATLQGKEVNTDAEVPNFPLTGADLIAKGMKPGPEMGAKLGQLKQKWKASNFTATKDDLLKENIKSLFEDLDPKSELYVDMDGVLADFFGVWNKMMGVKHWKDIPDIDKALQKIKDTDDFWINLPMTPNGKNLLNAIKQFKGKYNILSAPLPGDPNSEPQKRAWIRKHLGMFPPAKIIIDHNKAAYAKQADGTPNALIDDFGENISKWRSAGGVGIQHKDIEVGDTISKLAKELEDGQEPVNEAIEMKISDLTISDAGMAIAQSVGGGSRTDAPLAVTKLPSGHVYLVNGYHRLVDAMQAGKDTVSVEYVPYEKVEILWKQEREQDIKYGKQFNEESEIWQWNKEDPNNPEVHIQGYGRLMLNQIEDSIVGKLKELTKMAERGDFEQIQSLLDRDVMQSMMKAVVDTKAELQATRKRGGPKSRGINRESILDVIGKSEIKELDLKEFTLNRETSVKEEEKKNDLLKGFDPRTERALMMLKAKYPQADNILSALLADVENNEEDSDIADLSHELKMDKLLKAVEVLQKEINLLKGGKKLNVVKETGGVGKIVPGINTTVDVGPNEITKQAAKFGNKVSKDGLPKKTFRRK